MEVSQITGAGKDPVAHVEEDKQLKNIGAIPAVQSVKKDEDAKQSIPEQPSFEHLRQEPLRLLLRAISACVTQTFGTPSAVRNIPPVVEQTLTPEVVSARVLVMLGTAFEHFKIEHADRDLETVSATFRSTANEALLQGGNEAREVLGNLSLLDDSVAAEIEKTVALIQKGLAHFAS